MPGKCSFKNIWLEDTCFTDWLRRASDIHKARCRVCMKDFGISNMGEAALTSHATGQRHIKFMEMLVKGTVSISGIFRSSSAVSQDQGSQAHTSSSGKYCQYCHHH